jgi:hypothetical protein
MNIAQQLFVVFFAIAWGTSSNAWPGWKPFHWTFFFEYPQVRCRLGLSMLFLNCCPIVYFATLLAWLGQSAPTSTALTVIDYFREVFRGVAPAFAVFGFYRIWFSLIERRPSLFYLTDATRPPELKDIEPTSDSLHILERLWHINLLFGAIYVLLPLIVVWCLSY